jgi:hypothetical protein
MPLSEYDITYDVGKKKQPPRFPGAAAIYYS